MKDEQHRSGSDPKIHDGRFDQSRLPGFLQNEPNRTGTHTLNRAERAIVKQGPKRVGPDPKEGQRERVQIGCNFSSQPKWKFLLGVPLIYLPLLVGLLPIAVSAFLVRTHLKLVGGHQLRSYWDDFVPTWVSHRYTRKNQIVPHRVLERFPVLALVAKSRLFWIFNCKLYCPLSVALIAYVLYLVKIVEQWWCPFGHDAKHAYADVPIDKSFWHAAGDDNLLHPEDRANPSWNQDAQSSQEEVEVPTSKLPLA